MTKLKDHLWLWGQTPGCHHAESNNRFQLPGTNQMTAAEGCDFFGIPNCCRIAMGDQPKPPFDNESKALAHLKNVTWSLIGSGGVRAEQNEADLDEVIRQAKMYPNITGGVLDDFLNEHRRSIFSPEKINAMRQKLNREIGRPMDLWVVVYEGELKFPIQPYLELCDVITFWTWHSSHLFELERNMKKLIELTPGKRRLCGCYLWNYGEAKAHSVEAMQFQLEHYLRFIQEGWIEGIVLCSNCVADIGLDTVEFTRQWIAEHAEIEVPPYRK